MTSPLAILFYKNLLPGSQLVNRLHDLDYRVQTTNDLSSLTELAGREKPLVLIIDLAGGDQDLLNSLAAIKKNPETEHLPILAFGTQKEKKLIQKAQESGVTLVASDAAILAQLPQLLDQVLDVP